MRHLYQCPLRWADLDMLGHVNNVIYVDYLQEARVDMLRRQAPHTRAEDLSEGVVVVRHEVTYLAPLSYRLAPVSIECWVTSIRAASFTMAYEIFDAHEDGSRTVYLRANTVLTPYVFATESPRRLNEADIAVLQRFFEPTERPKLTPYLKDPKTVGEWNLNVRFSDVDVYGHVNNVKYFEYFQEARIPFLRQFAESVGITEAPMVVAQTDVDYRAPILFREQPYLVRTWLAGVGRKSITIETDIIDGDRQLSRARVVMVLFDPATQSSIPIRDDLREVLQRAVG